MDMFQKMEEKLKKAININQHKRKKLYLLMNKIFRRNQKKLQENLWLNIQEQLQCKVLSKKKIIKNSLKKDLKLNKMKIKILTLKTF